VSWLNGSGVTAFGTIEGSTPLSLMTEAATEALQDAGLERREVDGLLCGYATTMPHLMLATVFAEHFGLRPSYAHAIQLGGATGYAMVMLAHAFVGAGVARNVLVAAGENRRTGQSRDDASRPWPRSAIRSTRCRSGPPSPPITASSRPATCTRSGSSEAGG
jgi:3-oxoacyl-[acyl-carrier-protein] synthase III